MKVLKKHSFYDEVFFVEVTVMLVSSLGKNGGECLSEDSDDGIKHYKINLIEINQFDLVHECIHLTKGVFEDRGIPLNLKEDDETFAYYHNYWCCKIWKVIKNWKKSRK